MNRRQSYAREARAWLEELCNLIDQGERLSRTRLDWWTLAAPLAVSVAAAQTGCRSEEPPRYPKGGGEVCSDGVDNDRDDLVDCADPDCRDSCVPVPVYAAPPAPRSSVERDCGNGYDDDSDGLIDRDDPDCQDLCSACDYAAPMPEQEEDCGNGRDDDGDGLVDRADPDCRVLTAPAYAATPRPPREGRCDDGLDNDGDGAIDCADSDCRSFCNGAEYGVPFP